MKCPYCKRKLTLVLKGKKSGNIYICYKCNKLIYEEELKEKSSKSDLTRRK